MFTKKDYEQYFDDFEKELTSCVIIYTDLLNVLGDRSVLSRISMLTAECLSAYRFIRDEKEKLNRLEV